MNSLYLYHSDSDEMSLLLNRLHCQHGSNRHAITESGIALCWTHDLVSLNEMSSVFPKLWWLNDPDSVKKCLDRAHMQSVFDLNQVPHRLHLQHGRTLPDKDAAKSLTMNNKNRYKLKNVRLHIPVFNLKALAVYQSANQSTKKTNAFLWPKACKLAIRAVQSLQLDFALITLEKNHENQYNIIHVNPAPRCTSSLARLFAEAIESYINHTINLQRPGTSVWLGADIEFIIVDTSGKLIPASKFLTRNGQVGLDALRTQGSKRVHPIAELRPRPARTPDGLMRNIRLTMRLAKNKIRRPGLRWLAGGMPVEPFALGGHLHISKMFLHSRLVRVLDHYLALPLMMCESPQSLKRRFKYGRLSDVRKQFHGGFEYRTLPSWIVSPRLARGVISLFYLLARCFHELPADRCRHFSHLHLHRAYFHGDKATLSPIVEALWEDIEQLTFYPRYRSEIESFREQSLQMRAWNESADIRNMWRMH